MLGVTFHGIDPQYEITSAVLTAEPFPHPHTSVRMKIVVDKAVFRVFSIEDKKIENGILSISLTTDNASNNKKAWPTVLESDAVDVEEGEHHYILVLYVYHSFHFCFFSQSCPYGTYLEYKMTDNAFYILSR